MTDHRRIREGDVLSDMQTELCRQALNLKPHDADERVLFLAAVRGLLDAVPDKHQRLAWSLQLSMAATLGMQLQGIPGEFDLAQIWKGER